MSGIRVIHMMALAKSVAPEFIDYIHLAKTTDGWKIVNVLWESVE